MLNADATISNGQPNGPSNFDENWKLNWFSVEKKIWKSNEAPRDDRTRHWSTLNKVRTRTLWPQDRIETFQLKVELKLQRLHAVSQVANEHKCSIPSNGNRRRNANDNKWNRKRHRKSFDTKTKQKQKMEMRKWKNVFHKLQSIFYALNNTPRS